MNSKIYKCLYFTFNILVFFIGIFIPPIYAKVSQNFAIFTLDDGSLPSVNLEFLPTFLIVAYILFLTKLLINIFSKNKNGTERKTKKIEILSILIWGASIVIWIFKVNNFSSGEWTLYTFLFITLIIMFLSLYYLFKTKKNKYSKLDILPLLIASIFIFLIFWIIHVNGKFRYIGTSNFNGIMIIDYIVFIIIPVQLVNIYNLFNLKSKK